MWTRGQSAILIDKEAFRQSGMTRSSLHRLQRAGGRLAPKLTIPAARSSFFACAQAAVQEETGIRGVGLELSNRLFGSRGPFVLIRLDAAVSSNSNLPSAGWKTWTRLRQSFIVLDSSRP